MSKRKTRHETSEIDRKRPKDDDNVDMKKKVMVLYEELRKRNVEEEKKISLIGEILRLLRGYLFEGCRKHDVSRAVQCCLVNGSESQRQVICNSLETHYTDLLKSKYGRHVIEAVLRYCPKEFDSFLKEVYPDLQRIVQSRISARTISDIYANASRVQKRQILWGIVGNEWMSSGTAPNARPILKDQKKYHYILRLVSKCYRKNIFSCHPIHTLTRWLVEEETIEQKTELPKNVLSIQKNDRGAHISQDLLELNRLLLNDYWSLIDSADGRVIAIRALKSASDSEVLQIIGEGGQENQKDSLAVSDLDFLEILKSDISCLPVLALIARLSPEWWPLRMRNSVGESCVNEMLGSNRVCLSVLALFKNLKWLDPWEKKLLAEGGIKISEPDLEWKPVKCVDLAIEILKNVSELELLSKRLSVEVLKNCLRLVSGQDLPDSFLRYMERSVMEGSLAKPTMRRNIERIVQEGPSLARPLLDAFLETAHLDTNGEKNFLLTVVETIQRMSQQLGRETRPIGKSIQELFHQRAEIPIDLGSLLELVKEYIG